MEGPLSLLEAQETVEKYAPKEYYAENYRGGELDYLPHICRQVAKLAGGRALDIGPGWGTMMTWLANEGWRVDVADRQELGVYLTHELAHKADSGYVVCDINLGTPSQFAEGNYDLVLLTAVLLHLKWRPDAALRNAARMLKGNGVLLATALDSASYPKLTTPFDDWRDVPAPPSPARTETVVCSYTGETFRQLLESVFHTVAVWQPKDCTVFIGRAQHMREPAGA